MWQDEECLDLKSENSGYCSCWGQGGEGLEEGERPRDHIHVLSLSALRVVNPFEKGEVYFHNRQ